MVGVHSASGGLDVGQVVRMAWSTTMTPGVDGEFALAAHPEVTPVSTHVDIYSYRNRHANKHQVNWSKPPDECLVLSDFPRSCGIPAWRGLIVVRR